jgi:hypothetical protein
VVFVAQSRNFATHLSLGTLAAHLPAADKKSGNFEKNAAKADHFCKLMF